MALVAILGFAAILAGLLAWQLLKTSRAQRVELLRVRTLFSRYVPEPVVDELLARKDPRLLEARSYRATILSCRIRSFALIAEQLTPRETLRYLNEFYTLVGGAVRRHGGMIEALHDDGVTAVFGVLHETAFQEERALRTALDIVRLAHAMDARWRDQGRKTLEVSVGVNSGTIVAGDTGYQLRREFAVVGHAVHVAACLQAFAEEINAGIVASKLTFDAVSDLFVGLPTAPLPLHGLKQVQSAYIVRGLAPRVTENDLLALPSDRYFKQTEIVDAWEPPTPEQPHVARPAGAPSRFSALDDALSALPDLPLAP